MRWGGPNQRRNGENTNGRVGRRDLEKVHLTAFEVLKTTGLSLV